MSLMKVTQNNGYSQFIAESPEEIKLVCGSGTISLKELLLRIGMHGTLLDYNGEICADKNNFLFIIHEVKNKCTQFDVLLESASEKLSIKRVKACYISYCCLTNNPPYFKFHCNDGIE